MHSYNIKGALDRCSLLDSGEQRRHPRSSFSLKSITLVISSLPGAILLVSSQSRLPRSQLLSKVDAAQISRLLSDLQTIAYDAGHKRPLLIGVDQEGGMVSRYGDGVRATRFPGGMAIAAAQSPSLAFDVAKASAAELRAVGFNWNFAPVLDVNSDSRNPVIGVRSFGDNPREVGRFGVSMVKGLQAGGVAVCCKHFPGHGATDVDSHLGLPLIRKTRAEIEQMELIPFRRIFTNGVDSVSVAHISLPDITGDEVPACLSPAIATTLLRVELNFDGVAVSDDLEMQASLGNRGIEKAVTKAALAGCDIMMICHTFERQQKGINALIAAYNSGKISKEHILQSARRISTLKDRYLSWETELATPDVSLPRSLVEEHRDLCQLAYDSSVTVVRDDHQFLPLDSVIQSSDSILLLTPVVKPLNRTIEQSYPTDPFEVLGRAISKRHPRVRHAPYTSHGMTPTHETLIRQANAVIFTTSNGNRLDYQINLAKEVASLCEAQHIPIIALAVCNPYDLASLRSIGTYICTYEYTDNALETAVAVIFGEIIARGVSPVSLPGYEPKPTHRQWQVEEWQDRRDLYATLDLWEDVFGDEWSMTAQALQSVLCWPSRKSRHFVVRNASNNQLLGFAASFVIECDAGSHSYLIGSLALLIVNTNKRNLGIGLSLHDHVVKYLLSIPRMQRIQLGSVYPRFFPGLPTTVSKRSRNFFSHRGWWVDQPVYDMWRDIEHFEAPIHSLQEGYTLVQCTPELADSVIQFERENFSHYPGWVELYQACAMSNFSDIILCLNNDGIVMASVIAYSAAERGPFAQNIPWLGLFGARTGGIACLGIDKSRRDLGLGVGLVCFAIESLRARGITGCFCDWVRSNISCSADFQVTHRDWYSKMGFQEWRAYNEAWMQA